MQAITWEQRNKRFETLSEELKPLYASEIGAAALRNAFSKHQLPEEKYREYGIIVGDIILGFVPKSQLAALLTSEAQIETGIAQQIAADLADFLAPVAGTISETNPLQQPATLSTNQTTPQPVAAPGAPVFENSKETTPEKPPAHTTPLAVSSPVVPEQPKVAENTAPPKPEPLRQPGSSNASARNPEDIDLEVRERLHLRPKDTKPAPTARSKPVIPTKEAAVSRTMKADIEAVKNPAVQTTVPQKNTAAPEHEEVAPIPRFRKPLIDPPGYDTQK